MLMMMMIELKLIYYTEIDQCYNFLEKVQVLEIKLIHMVGHVSQLSISNFLFGFWSFQFNLLRTLYPSVLDYRMIMIIYNIVRAYHFFLLINHMELAFLVFLDNELHPPLEPFMHD